MPEPNIRNTFIELKKIYDLDLLSILLGIDEKTLKQYTTRIRGEDKGIWLTETQKAQLVALIDITDIMSALPIEDQRLWWVSFSHYYLFGYPAEEFIRRPSDVRLAAMMKVAGREDNDLL